MVSNNDEKIYNVFPPGHFYSPVPDITQVRNSEERIFNNRDKPQGIDLNDQGQIELLNVFQKYYEELPFTETKNDPLRYYFNNNFFSFGDGIVLYSMIRHLKPKHIIEVGCGYSSCIFLDTNEFFFDNSISCSFIEPYPERLLELMKKDDLNNIDLKREKLEDIDKNIFSSLEAGDILFIDSTHVSKINSDVNYIFFEILPLIRPGVFIHFHDIFYPFEYPKEWLYQGIFWNEAYLLRAFLEFNNAFQIEFFNTYLYQKYPEVVNNILPLFSRNPGGSLWISRI